MSPTITFIFTVLVCNVAVNAAAHHSHDKGPHDRSEKHDKPDKHSACQEFTRGLSFNDSQAVGSWHLLHYKMEQTNGTGDSYCVQFSPVNDQERKDLNELIGKFVENLKWENLVLKMQIPCGSVNTNKNRDYYLEKLGDDGSYRVLQMPPASAKLDLAGFNRYPMRLKVIEGRYLGMMDCLHGEKFVFILGKQLPEGKEIDERLRRMIEVYWPEEI